MNKTSLDKSKIKFLLLEGVHPSALEVIRGAGYSQIETLPKALQGEELKAKLADVHFLGIRSQSQLTAGTDPPQQPAGRMHSDLPMKLSALSSSRLPSNKSRAAG